MNIEVMAWSSFAAGLATYALVKSLSWLPDSLRLLLWFSGTSFMGFAMVYGVAAYDPKLLRQATEIAYWIMLVSRIAVPILAVYAIFKWGKAAVRVLVVASLLTTACGANSNDHPALAIIVMGMLVASFTWLCMEAIGYLTLRGRDEDEAGSTTAG